jgi:hypothetical protein
VVVRSLRSASVDPGRAPVPSLWRRLSLLWLLCYVVLRRVLQLAALRLRSQEFKELEIVVLRRELAVLAELDHELGHRRARQPSAQDTDQEANRDGRERQVE